MPKTPLDKILKQLERELRNLEVDESDLDVFMDTLYGSIEALLDRSTDPHEGVASDEDE